MRTSLASLTIVFMVSAVFAEKFGPEKVQVGKKKCTCSFDFTVSGGAAKGRGGCDKKCSGSVSSMSLEGEEYIFTFGMSVKKGKVAIKGALAAPIGATTEEATTVEVETTEGPGGGAGSGSGRPTRPPGGGSGGPGSGGPEGPGSGSGGPGGNGGGPTGGNGGGPMSSGNCASGFVLVCPEVDGSCQLGAQQLCPLDMPAAGRMMPPAPQGEQEDCLCLPIVLMQLVMARPEVMPMMRSLHDSQDLDRQSADGDKFPTQPVQVGKKTCKCSFTFVVDGKKVKASGSCDKKCSGAVKTMELEGENFSYTFGMSVKKGKVAIKGAKATAVGGEGSAATVRPPVGGGGGSGSGRPPIGGGGSGSGRPPIGGGGSGSGMPGGGMGSGCVCVHGPGGEGGPPTGGPGGSGSGSGETPVTMPTGETPVTILPTGETPVTILPTGETPITMPTVATTEAPGGNGTGPSVTTVPGTTVPNPGSSGETSTISIVQSWSQETDYSRTASVVVPATQAGQKLPLVVDLHGNGGQGNVGRLSYLGDAVVIVAPNGYERSWNINNEASKADDVSFLLALIAKVTADFPAADSNDVTIVGTSNGAAMIYRLLIETGADRPFHRVLPMVSSLISVQWHDDQFWKNADYTTNDHSIAAVLEFSDTFEYAHFHGTEDGAIAYEGKSPGPGFLGANVDVIAAQKTDFLFARAMGYTGAQLADSAGVTIGTDFQEYSYLGGRVKHFKDIGGTHGSTFGNAVTEDEVKKAILGTA